MTAAPLDLLHYGLGTLSGGVVGFTLGLVGGGGSILAVPLMLHVVGVRDPHVAIGTSAFAVALSAAANLIPHARAGHVNWSCALIFAAAGSGGAAIGSTVGKAVDGGRLIALFAVLMLVIAVSMLRGRRAIPVFDGPIVAWTRLPRIIGTGGAVGLLAGFFGIGGGFLIVPGLVNATGMPLIYGIGSSLVGVTAFGLTTAANYALSGYVDWALAAAFVLGGVAGGTAGVAAAKRLSRRDGGHLNIVFGGIIAVVALYMAWRGLFVD